MLRFGIYIYIYSGAVSFDGYGLGMDEIVARRMDEVYAYLIVEWFFFMALAIYLEMVLKTGYGVKKHPLFFIKKVIFLIDTLSLLPPLR